MRDKFKIFIITLVFATLLTCLAGCKQDSPDEPARYVEVVFMCRDNEGAWIDDDDLEIRQKVVKVPYGQACTDYLPEHPTRRYYRFVGWYVDGNDLKFQDREPVYSRISVYAQWIKDEFPHTVKFVIEGQPENTVASQEVPYKGKASVPKLDRSIKWYTNKYYKKEFDFNTPIEENITLYSYYDDFRGSWGNFLTFLNSKDADWFNDENQSRAFVIVDNSAKTTEGIAPAVGEAGAVTIKERDTRITFERDDEDADIDTEKSDEKSVNLSLLSKLKSKSVILDMRDWTSLETLYYRSFRGAEKLTMVILPESVTKIANEVFRDCTNLQLQLPSKLTSIGKRAFMNCSSLTNVKIPEGVTQIGEEAFRKCKTLKKLTLPSTLKVIPYMAFAQCEALPQLIIPEGVETLEDGCFGWCGPMDKVYYPSTLSKVSMFFFIFSSYKLKDSATYNGTKEYWEKNIAPIKPNDDDMPKQYPVLDKNGVEFNLGIFYVDEND
ncbi:repeat domain-containing protein [Treponema sp. JC4]|uniref:leucine-rich repeat domain-containing protein n=1 Tax=Treponema sp. JC4 TaxID=1124982 RepID=UPI00025B0A23|nr:leucine-rich repeat domain-containing protein [Treponema sp. JC4]EID85739.1 repeat domain-containing protein [Treponema sp. JC4]